MKTFKVFSITILLWLICLSIYGWMHVTNMMNYLKVNPSGDLYANDIEFQFIAFIFTRGFPAFLLLVVILFVEKIIIKNRNAPIKKIIN